MLPRNRLGPKSLGGCVFAVVSTPSEHLPVYAPASRVSTTDINDPFSFYFAFYPITNMALFRPRASTSQNYAE